MTKKKPATGRLGAALEAAAALGVSCSYCNADVALTESRPGLHFVEVRHSDSCPDYQARRARGAAS